MSKTPFRQIRASYDDKAIIVYQAYPSSIADAAVAHQRLDASPDFSTTRMTWIKPSWCWMMYRCGYSYKDRRQERVLALHVTHEAFHDILRSAVVHDGATPAKGMEHQGNSKTVETNTGDSSKVAVQWDPERDPWLCRLDYRSIQIGVRGAINESWISKGITKIEDVTDRAKMLKEAVDEGGSDLTNDMLVEQGLMPLEREYSVNEELRSILFMDCEPADK